METEQELREQIAKAKAEAVKTEEDVFEEQEEEEQESEASEPEESEGEEVENDVDEEPEFKNKRQAEAFKKMRLSEKEARQKEESARQELQEMKERLARLEGASQKEPEKKEEDPEPDREIDPEAHVEWQVRQSNKRIEALQNELKSFKQKSEVSEAEKAYNTFEQDYSSKDTQYADAKKWLVEDLVSEAKDKYPNKSEVEIRNAIRQQELSVVGTLANQGMTEEQIFRYIKLQAMERGYQLSSEKPDPKKLDRNRKRSANLNDAPSAGETGMSLKSLNSMDNEKLEQLMNNPKEYKKAQEAVRKARLALLNG